MVELSLFHQTHGIYAHGVAPDTAWLPREWEQRCHRITVATTDGEALVHAPELHDLAFSKLAAGRPKDIEYVRELLRCSLIGLGRLEGLIADAEVPLRSRFENVLKIVRRVPPA